MGGSKKKSLLWEKYGYFLELHVVKEAIKEHVIDVKIMWVSNYKKLLSLRWHIASIEFLVETSSY